MDMITCNTWKACCNIPHNLLMQVGDIPLSYDSRGNLISKGNYTYTYDPENRLTMVKENGIPVAEYWYDGLGNRVRSLENGEEIYYIYNGLNIIQEHNVTANSRTDYIFVGIRRIAEKTDDVVRYYHTDHLGSTRLMTDSQGSIVAEYKYYPYGANLAQSILDPSFDGATYRFTGKGDSPNTGLYYFGARSYDPEVGKVQGNFILCLVLMTGNIIYGGKGYVCPCFYYRSRNGKFR